MKYKLLKDLPFMAAGTVFERQCKDDDECCVFGISYHNCVKHYDDVKISDSNNKVLCAIIDDPDRVRPIIMTAREAVNMYDTGKCTLDELVSFIEAY